MTIDELLEHYRYKLALPNLTQHSRTVAEATYGYLERLKPMKPIGWNNECWNCGVHLNVYDARPDFCPSCGQKIDWSEE